jgi:hypothetical protein
MEILYEVIFLKLASSEANPEKRIHMKEIEVPETDVGLRVWARQRENFPKEIWTS